MGKGYQPFMSSTFGSGEGRMEHRGIHVLFLFHFTPSTWLLELCFVSSLTSGAELPRRAYWGNCARGVETNWLLGICLLATTNVERIVPKHRNNLGVELFVSLYASKSAEYTHACAPAPTFTQLSLTQNDNPMLCLARPAQNFSTVPTISYKRIMPAEDVDHNWKSATDLSADGLESFVVVDRKNLLLRT